MSPPEGPYICLWCGKDHYFNERRSMGWLHYCSDECYIKDQKYGKIREFLKTPYYLFWKLYFKIEHFIFRKRCPECHCWMNTLLANELYLCTECFNTYEIHHYKIF